MTKQLSTSVLSKDLTVTKNRNQLVKLFKTADSAEDILKEAELEFSELVQNQDVTTDKGRKEISANATKMVTLKTTVVKVIKADYLDPTNAEKKIVTLNIGNIEKGLDVFRDKIKKPLVEYREKQAKHIENCENKIHQIKAMGLNNNDGLLLTLDMLKNQQINLDGFQILEIEFKEFTDEAQEALDASIESNAEHIRAEEKRIADAEELEKLRLENERIKAEAQQKENERLAKEKEEEDKRQKAEKIRLEKEAEERLIQQEQLDKLKKESEEREAEIERLKKAEADRIEEEKDRILQEELDAADKNVVDKWVEEQHANIQSESKPPEAAEEEIADNDIEANKTHNVADTVEDEPVVLPLVKGELKVINKNSQPYGIRDDSGFLFFFVEVTKYSGQEQRYKNDIDKAERLSQFLFSSLLDEANK